MRRRQFLRLLSGATAVSPAIALSGCGGGADAWEALVAANRAPLPAAPALRDLVRYATLAANGHNTQPWLFEAGDASVAIRPDFARRTPVVDPDDHHLYASLGCAAENLSIAAAAGGLSGRIESAGPAGVTIGLAPAPSRDTPLLDAIARRQCSRAEYSGQRAGAEATARLQAAAAIEGVDTLIVDEPGMVEKVLELVIDGNSRQMDNPAFVDELKRWIRFNAADAARTGDGLYAAASGNPSLPSLLGPVAFGLFFSRDAENDKYARHIRSSSGLAVFVAAGDDPAGWVAAGRACQRFMLQATLEGMACAFVNQTVEEIAPRAALRQLLGLGDRRPNLVLRYGFGPHMPWSVRRPPEASIVRV